MIEHIPDLVDAGIDSWKIEGRMKTALYVATVARTYRKAIDDYLESPQKYEQNMPWYMEQIKSCTYRQFTTGFFYGKPSEEAQIYDSNTYEKGYTYLGIVGPKGGVPEREGVMQEETEQSCRNNAEINAKPENACGMYRIEQRNKFSVGETIEVMKPNGENIPATVRRMVDAEGNEMDSCPHPKQVFYVDLGMELEEYDILRRAEDEVEQM
jgi:putative protease